MVRNSENESLKKRAIRQSAFAFALLISSVPAGFARAQTNDFREYFPQMELDDWSKLASGDAENTEAVTGDIALRLENIPDWAWANAIDATAETLAGVVRSPREFACRAFRFDGRVVDLAPTTGEVGRDDGVRPIWRVAIQTRDGGELIVLTDRVPKTLLKKGNANGQRVSGRGVFVFANNSRPVLVSDRLPWFPDQVNDGLHIGEGQMVLADGGLDIGLLDDIRQYSDAAVGTAEHDVFQQFLRAVDRADEQGNPPIGKPVDLVVLAQSPREHVGQLFLVEGKLRRITPVEVPDDFPGVMVEDHRYFQLDVFVPLGHRTLVLGAGSDGPSVEIHGGFGVTVLLARLPSELKNRELPVEVAVPAFFLKIWKHKTIATRAVSPELRRPNPVFVGLPRAARVVDAEDPTGLGLLIAAFWIGLIGVVAGLVVWSRGRSRSHLSRREIQLPGKGISSN